MTVRRFWDAGLVALGSAAAAAALAQPASSSSATAPPNPSWTCIAGVCLGHGRLALDYRFGAAPEDIPSRDIRRPGGKVWACFWRCSDAVTEDGFTFYGGTIRPANNLLTVGTCNPIVKLPDGVGIGTKIPFGKSWQGYRSIRMEGFAFGWEKRLRVGGKKVVVTLNMDRGRVRCIYLERG